MIDGEFVFARFGRVRWFAVCRHARRVRPTSRFRRWPGRGPAR